MPPPLLFTTKNNVENLDTSSDSIQASIEIQTNKEEEDDERYNWHELTILEHNSLLTSLNHICNYWRQIVFNKVRFILTPVFVAMINITNRLMCFTRRRTTVRSTSPLSSIITSPSSQRFEEDINHSLTSFLNFNSQINLPSSETSSMARTLVQQQTPNLNIHQTTSTQDESLSSMTHSVDDSLFYYKPDSSRILQLLQRFASEPQMSKFQSTSNGYLNKTLPLTNTFLPLNQPEEEEEEINYFNCDKIEPIITDDVKSNELDNISPATTIDELDEDILLNTNSSLNPERHFRRRKRRSSLTKTPSFNGETELIITDSIEKLDDNNNNIQEEKSQETNKNLQSISIENLSLNENNNQEKQESNDKITPPNGLRGRRLRYRSYRQTSSTSQEPISDETVQFFVPTETPISTSPVSPISPVGNITPSCNSPNASTGGLKRNGSIGTTKKMVRFADSVGRELAEVQYIQSLTDDDSNVFSFVKNNLYIPKAFNSEYKPWSFDVALTSKQLYDNLIPRRFFCLYRQPNSEHPDVYLHEIWKSQIKLEHADVRLKSSSTSEQYLYGTLWVTNAGFWKNVTIKYSFNRWLNTYEYEARHRCHSNDFRNIDQFEFSIDIPSDVDRIDFVLRYHVNGQEHWDNNEGKNYTIETESASTPQTTISLPHDCDFNEMRFY